jgi:hypothetical protein
LVKNPLLVEVIAMLDPADRRVIFVATDDCNALLFHEGLAAIRGVIVFRPVSL